MPKSYTDMTQYMQDKSFIIKAGLVMMLFLLALVGSVSAVSNRSYAANVNGNKLQCFSGTGDNAAIYGGDCAFQGNNAVIATTDPGELGSYGGVFIQNSNLGGKLLADVNKLAFTYDGTGAAGGSPRLSIPIDENNDGGWDAFAFADSSRCNDGDINKGTLDAINNSTCVISYRGTDYDNWAAFMAANPTFRIAKDAVTFVIVDQPGSFTISNVQLGKGPAKPAQNSPQVQY